VGSSPYLTGQALVHARLDQYQSLHVAPKKGNVTTFSDLSKPGSIRELISAESGFSFPYVPVGRHER